MIEHTVTFRLVHPAGSPGETDFLAAARELAAIPGVLDYTIKRQTSPKLDHTFGISMRFASQEDYDAYNVHPLHERFIRERWIPEVADFQEADFEEL
ncbi:MAG: Dabb family protein [Verrucomicrobiae bacterium]|nr:Dabb family protein [Verrucomicrobiae bacterium]